MIHKVWQAFIAWDIGDAHPRGLQVDILMQHYYHSGQRTWSLVCGLDGRNRSRGRLLLMKGRDAGSGSHGAATGSRSEEKGEDEVEGKLRIHLKRSCTERKVVQGDTARGLTTDDWHKFKRLLASKTFEAHNTQRIRGQDLTAEWAGKSGFREPIIVPDKAGMDLKVPGPAFTVADVARVVGEDTAVRPIHVGEQANIDQSMTLAEFAEYFETCTKPGQAILNMISLEFSETPMAEMVQSPKLVRDIDWLNTCWPDDRKGTGEFPKVQYYCLMSQGGSYTDFHVDFGGTSVWYHVLRGKKEFLLIRPTRSNVDLYQKWIRSPTQSQVFFGDLADVCYRVVLNAGETLMIPSGWIHAVFTPKPSLVFGGNFLHSLNIPMQLQIHEIEVRAKIHSKFRFPYFKEMMFFAASRFLTALRSQQGNLDDMSTDKESPEAQKASELKVENADESEKKEQQIEEDQATPASTKGDVDSAVAAGAVDSLSLWEKEGLPPLVEACRSWLAEETKKSAEGGDVPEEWHSAGARAGCSDVHEMIKELGSRVPLLEKAIAAASSNPSVGDKPSSATLDDEPLLTSTAESRSGDAVPPADGPDAGPSGNDNGRELAGGGAEEEGERGSRQDSSREDTALAALSAAAAMTLAVDGDKMPAEGEDVDGDEEDDEGDRAQGAQGDNRAESEVDDVEQGSSVSGASGGAMEEATSSPPAGSAYSIPKLKISLKPQPARPTPGDEAASRSSGDGADLAKTGAAGGGTGRLKLVLKGPALSPRAGVQNGTARPDEASMSGRGRSGRAGGTDTVRPSGQKRGRQQRQQQQQQQPQRQRQRNGRWDDDPYGSDSGDSDDGDDDGDKDEDDDDDDHYDGYSSEERVGRGGKRRARPLGSRLRAIARLGDDAAAGDSEDDNSADEYKPGDEDDVLPGDHKFRLDADDVREAKKSKSSVAGAASPSPSSASGRNGNDSVSSSGTTAGGKGSGGTWSGGFGGASGGMSTMGGMRRLPVTKQEALRSKGLFKIAPQSKVPVQADKKGKKALTAKQKLMAKMRR